jgi:hypothetical protein
MYTHTLIYFYAQHTHTHTPFFFGTFFLVLGAEWAAQVDRGKGGIPVADYRLATEIPYSVNSVRAVSGIFLFFPRIPVADCRLATEIPYSSYPSLQEGNQVSVNSLRSCFFLFSNGIM